jgi:hypothetical protein
MSLRKAQVVKSPSAGRDSWSAQAEIDVSLSPNFVNDVDAGGLTVAIYDADQGLVDSESFTAAECTLTSAGRSVRCKNASRATVRFARRPAPGFFRMNISVSRQSLILPVAPTDTPLGVVLTSPVGQSRADSVNSCATKSNRRTLCKDTP